MASPTIQDELPLHGISNSDVAFASFRIIDLGVYWILNHPRSASRFALNGSSMAMRAVSLHIRELEEENLPLVVCVFLDSIHVLCGNLFDDEGFLNVQDMAITIAAISSLDRHFWERNEDLQNYLAESFPQLYAWVVLVGEMVAKNRQAVQGSERRLKVLCLLDDILGIMRAAGHVGGRFIEDHPIRNDLLSIWGRTLGTSLAEDKKLGDIFIHVYESFPRSDSTTGFVSTVLSILQEFGKLPDDVVIQTMDRLCRAVAHSSIDERDPFIHQQLLVVRALLEDHDPRNLNDPTPIYHSFFDREGFRYVCGLIRHCADIASWRSASICIEIVANFLQSTQSNIIFRSALGGNLITQLAHISRFAHQLTSTGRMWLTFLLRQFLGQMLLSKSLNALAEGLKGTLREDDSLLINSEYCVDWHHLFALHRSISEAFRRIAQGERCGNPTCCSVRFEECRYKKCSGCEMLFYCSEECQKRDWQNLGHREMCLALQNARVTLEMEPTDVRFLMTLAQEKVQLYIDENITKAEDGASFSIAFHPHADSDTKESQPRWYSIQELVHIEVPGTILPILPKTWRSRHIDHFNAVTSIKFTRNRKRYFLDFLSGYQVGGQRKSEVERPLLGSTISTPT